MQRQIKPLFINGLFGALAGLFFFALEMSIRLGYLYWRTFEQAPSGYAEFLIYYFVGGFLAGLAAIFLKFILNAVLKARQPLFRFGSRLAVLAMVLLAIFLLTRVLQSTELSLNQIVRHLGTVLGAVFVFFCILGMMGRLRSRWGTTRFLLGYIFAVALMVAAHLALLRSFSWERMLAQLPKPERANNAPNVLLLSIDTLRPDRLGAYGYAKNLTPNMDRLAGEGALFEQAISQAPWTRPSFGSLLTSTYPSQHGAFVVNDPAKGGYHANWSEMLYNAGLQDEVMTMAEIFRDHGYATLALQSNWQVSEAQNFDQGFQSFLYEPLFEISLWDRTFLGIYGSWVPAFFGAERKLPFYTSAPSADKVFEVFRALASQGLPQPFFMWINLMDTHSPYNMREQGVPVEKARVTASYDTWDSDIPIAALREAYDSEVQFVDHYIGKIYDFLKDRGILDDTIVVLLSDHGEDFEDHLAEIRLPGVKVHGRHHGHSLYNELLQVPLIIRFPSRIPQALRIKDAVRLLDVLPTVLELAKIDASPAREKFEGASLLPLMRNGKDSLGSRLCYSERTYFGLEQKAVQTDDYKLILHVQDGSLEFYNLKSDPKETKNLAALRSAEIDRLRSALDQWFERMGPLLPSSAPTSQKQLSKEESERLRSLGYIR